MKRVTLFVVLLLVLAFSAALAQEHDYLSQKRCVMCHKGAKKGNIFENWQEGPHAQAYATLATDKAKEVYGEGNPQEAAECLKCHITNGPEGTDQLEKELGVTCQACHGAGGDYWKMSVMKDHEKAVANGLVANPKEHCTDCHNEESPTYKPFNLEEFWAEVEHSSEPVE